MSQSASFSSINNFILLAPPRAGLGRYFDSVWRSNDTYTRMMSDMQRLRGRIYMQDGAITEEALTADGRHESESDGRSWHLLTTSPSGRVLGCLRYYRPKLTRFDSLNLRRAAVVKSRAWSPELLKAIRAELTEARQARFSYVEIGGWALAEELRCTTEALRGVLATYAWGQHIGGVIGITTATERNSSRLILRRLGGEPLEVGGEQVPPYYDKVYRCNMELLRFDSRRPNSKFSSYIDALRPQVAKIPVVCPSDIGPLKEFGSSLRRLATTPLWTDELFAGFL